MYECNTYVHVNFQYFLKLQKFRYVGYTGVCFITEESTATLSDREAASSCMPTDSRFARDTDKRNVFYLAE